MPSHKLDPSIGTDGIPVSVAKRLARPLSHESLLGMLHYHERKGICVWTQKRPRVVVGSRAGSEHWSGYRYITILGAPYPESWVIWFYKTGRWPTHHIDHKNRIRNDNRWCNLREATRKQNAENHGVRPDSVSGTRGVSWDSTNGKWRAYIYHNKKQYDFGLFEDLGAAVAARKAGERKFFTHAP